MSEGTAGGRLLPEGAAGGLIEEGAAAGGALEEEAQGTKEATEVKGTKEAAEVKGTKEATEVKGTGWARGATWGFAGYPPGFEGEAEEGCMRIEYGYQAAGGSQRTVGDGAAGAGGRGGMTANGVILKTALKASSQGRIYEVFIFPGGKHGCSKSQGFAEAEIAERLPAARYLYRRHVVSFRKGKAEGARGFGIEFGMGIDGLEEDDIGSWIHHEGAPHPGDDVGEVFYVVVGEEDDVGGGMTDGIVAVAGESDAVKAQQEYVVTA